MSVQRRWDSPRHVARPGVLLGVVTTRTRRCRASGAVPVRGAARGTRPSSQSPAVPAHCAPAQSQAPGHPRARHPYTSPDAPPIIALLNQACSVRVKASIAGAGTWQGTRGGRASPNAAGDRSDELRALVRAAHTGSSRSWRAARHRTLEKSFSSVEAVGAAPVSTSLASTSTVAGAVVSVSAILVTAGGAQLALMTWQACDVAVVAKSRSFQTARAGPQQPWHSPADTSRRRPPA